MILGVLGSRLTLVPPRFVLVLRNLATGELTAKKPGLRFVPFHCEKYVLLDCRPIAVEAVTIPVVTKDNQEVNVEVYSIYYIDGLEKEEDELKWDSYVKEEVNEEEEVNKEKKEVKIPRAVRAVRKLTKIKESEEELKKEITGIFSEVREAMVKKYLNMVTIAELDQRKLLKEVETTEEGKKEFEERDEYISEISPKYEGRKIGKDPEELKDSKDPEEKKKLEAIKKDLLEEKKELDSIKKDLLAHLSWFISKEADRRLAEFGIGCDLRVLNTPPPKALVQARLEQNIVDAWTVKAEKEKKLQEVKAKIIKDFTKETNISPATFYLVDKGIEAVREITSALKESKEGGEKK